MAITNCLSIFFIISRGKLPGELRAGFGILAVERVRQVDLAKAVLQIFLMQLFDFVQMFLQGLFQILWQRHHPILAVFAAPDENLIAAEVDIFTP